MKIAVLASTNGTDLQAILDEMADGKLPDVDLVKVLSNVEDAGALDKARTAGVEAIFVDPEGQSREEYDETMIQAIGEVDLICLIGYMRILSPIFVNKYAGKIINVHPSLLPKYGGKGWLGIKVHEAVLASGDSESGMTVHYVDESVDGGAIVLQEKCVVEPGDTAETLKARVQELEKKGYPEAIRLIQRGQR